MMGSDIDIDDILVDDSRAPRQKLGDGALPQTVITFNNGTTQTIEGTEILSTDIISSNRTKVVSAVIGEGVTTLCTGSFSGTSVSNVILPSTLSAINDSAFNGCNSLVDIDFPESLVVIGEYAFDGCNKLRRILIPDSVTSLGKAAFMDGNAPTCGRNSFGSNGIWGPGVHNSDITGTAHNHHNKPWVWVYENALGFPDVNRQWNSLTVKVRPGKILDQPDIPDPDPTPDVQVDIPDVGSLISIDGSGTVYGLPPIKSLIKYVQARGQKYLQHHVPKSQLCPSNNIGCSTDCTAVFNRVNAITVAQLESQLKSTADKFYDDNFGKVIYKDVFVKFLMQYFYALNRIAKVTFSYYTSTGASSLTTKTIYGLTDNYDSTFSQYQVACTQYLQKNGKLTSTTLITVNEVKDIIDGLVYYNSANSADTELGYNLTKEKEWDYGIRNYIASRQVKYEVGTFHSEAAWYSWYMLNKYEKQYGRIDYDYQWIGGWVTKFWVYAYRTEYYLASSSPNPTVSLIHNAVPMFKLNVTVNDEEHAMLKINGEDVGVRSNKQWAVPSSKTMTVEMSVTTDTDFTCEGWLNLLTGDIETGTTSGNTSTLILNFVSTNNSSDTKMYEAQIAYTGSNLPVNVDSYIAIKTGDDTYEEQEEDTFAEVKCEFFSHEDGSLIKDKLKFIAVVNDGYESTYEFDHWVLCGGLKGMVPAGDPRLAVEEITLTGIPYADDNKIVAVYNVIS